MRRSWLVKLKRSLAALLVTALVLIAVSMSLLRLAVAYAPQLRGEVERVLTQALERPLTLGGMRAAWAGRHPRLILEDVRLTGGPLAGLEIPELEVDVDLLHSLQTMQLQLAHVAVSGLEVRATYAADGSLQLTRVGNATVSPAALGGDQGRRRLPARIQLRDARVQLTDIPAGTTYRLSLVDLELAEAGSGYALAGYVPLPDALGQSIRFRAQWRGQQGAEDFSGKLYVDARRLRLQPLSALLSRIAPVPAVRGTAHVELWADLSPGGVEQASGRLTLAGAALPDQAQRWQTVADQLKGDFHWRRQSDGWDLAVADLTITSPYRVWPATELALRLHREADRQTLELAGNYLHLGDLAAGAAVLPFTPQPIRQWLVTAKPTAELTQPQLLLSWSANGFHDFSGHAGFRTAGLRPIGSLPGATGLAGEIQVDRAGGRLRIDAQQGGELQFAKLFRTPLPFHSLQGEAFWRLDASGGWTLEAPMIAAANSDGRAQARLRLIADGQGAPFIDLRAQVANGKGASVSRYLPVSVLPADVIKWLDQAGINARVPQADVLLFGRVNEFPFTRGTGLFHVQADFADARLDYQTGWPAVESAAGQLRFVGDSMDIRIDSGRVHGAAIEQARARIDQLGDAPLLISGKVRGSGQQLLGFLSESPLGGGIRNQLADMQLGGSHSVDLRLRIPFKSGSQVQVQGSIALNQASYQVPKWDLTLDQLQGQVNFTERGVMAERVTAHYRGVPVTLTAETGLLKGREQIRISGQLRTSLETLLGRDAPPGVEGLTDWDVELLLPGFQAPPAAGAALLELLVSSELQGVAVDLPAPFGKPAAEARLLRLSVPVREAGAGPARLDYGEDVHALLGFSADSLELSRAAIEFGPGEPVLPQHGLVIGGVLESFDLSDWQQPAAEAEEGVAAAEGLTLQLADVQIGQVRALGQEFANTSVRVQPSGDDWAIALAGPDVAGNVVLPAEPNAPIVARLERLRLQTGSAGRSAPATSKQGMAELPPLDVTVADLALRDQTLGQLELVTRSGAAGASLERARISGPLLELNLAGGSDRASTRSHLTATLSSRNVGKLLDALGYTDAMHGGVAQGNMNVAWDGQLLDFSLPALEGVLNLSLRNGQILKVEPGAGRLFGLLSIGDLPRRLSLDFSDLFGKGFAYDRIEAHLQLADGNAYTRQFYMQGPAARVELDGRIGLAARDYDQRVTVTPNVSTTLPAIGAVAAGPVGAVAGFVTQKLLQNEINKLSRYRYRVAGSWDSPEIEALSSSPGPAEAGTSTDEVETQELAIQ